MQQQAVEPDEICFNEIIRIYKDIKEPERARGVLKQMVDRTLSPTLVNFNSVMDAGALKCLYSSILYYIFTIFIFHILLCYYEMI